MAETGFINGIDLFCMGHIRHPCRFGKCKRYYRIHHAGLGLVCYSISSKVILLAKIWRREFKLANRIPMIPVLTALACLFLAAFVFELATVNADYFIPARVLVGLGAICFTLFSIVSILESGTSGKG